MTGGARQVVGGTALGGLAAGSVLDSDWIAVVAIVAGAVVGTVVVIVAVLLLAGLVCRRRKHALAVLDRLVAIVAVMRTGTFDVATAGASGCEQGPVAAEQSSRS